MSQTEYDVCVIGGGAAGLVTAAGAATLGAKVLLIERDKLGGDCLYTGCVPSKTLIHSAQVAHTVDKAGLSGVSAKLEGVKHEAVMERVAEIVSQIEHHDKPERFEAMGVEILFSSAAFIDDETVVASDRTITSKHFVIATGSRPSIPDIVGLDKARYFTNETIFNLSEQVDHLIVIGSGPVACELGQSYRRLTAEVTFLSDSGLLPQEDLDMTAIVTQQFQHEGISLSLNVTVEQVIETESGIAVQIMDATGQVSTIEGSHLLVAAGREKNLEGLGLERADVAIDDGQLVLDKRLRTTNKSIYACGDVAGPYLFTHMAEYQASIVIRNMLFKWPVKVSTKAVPRCTFTSPELARVGLSENEVRAENIKHCVYSFSFSDIDRAITDNKEAGQIKVITTPRGRILGACIVGEQAGELIAEYTLAMSEGLSISALSRTIHLYPSLAQINKRVADMRLKASLTPRRKKFIKRLFGLRG